MAADPVSPSAPRSTPPAGDLTQLLAPAPAVPAGRRSDDALRWALTGCLAAGIFALDVTGSSDLGVSLAYLPLIILAMWFGGERTPVHVAIGCAILTLAGWLLDQRISGESLPALVLLLTLCAIGISGALLAWRKRTAAEMESILWHHEQLKSLFHQIDLPIVVSDLEGKARFWNRGAERRYGYGRQETLAENAGRLSAADTMVEEREAMQRAIASDVCSTPTPRIANGGRHVDMQSIQLTNPAGAPLGVAMIDRDRSPEVETIIQMQQLALYDSLTSLPNRRHFYARLNADLALAERKSWLLALLFFDLDGFKRINDGLGHSAGDRLLCRIAERLMSCVRHRDYVGRRAWDIPETTISRLGGDEFTVILNEISAINDAARTAHRMLEAVSAPIDLDGQEVSVTSSVGIAIYPYDGLDAETLIRNADTAMYHAKALGRKRCAYYSEEMNEALRRRLDLAARLRRAVEQERLTLDYQPIFRTSDGFPVGAELLARWSDDDLGPISPDEFIPIAEETGLIDRIGTWVLRRSCEFAASWARANAHPISVAVNVSTHQFKLEKLIETVKDALQAAQLSPRLLTLEITESAVIDDDKAAGETLDELRALGIRVALDDFGTGYSSLSRLRRLGLDSLKIDRSFISAIGEDKRATDLVAAIIAMAHVLKLQVVAEGVETEEQLSFLRQHGCDAIQGYLLSRPLTGCDFERFLQGVAALPR
jgi:diguanylate cyclase (GGDEF)-like protein/PAS domain S-box-containing protein